MSRSDTPNPEPRSDLFPTTIWSLVHDADHDQTTVRGAALDALLQQYAPAMVTHLVRRKRIPLDKAEDMVQGFIADKVLEKGLVGKANEARGKFRTLLLTALDRYIISEFRAQSAQKRGGGRVASLDAVDAPVADPKSQKTPGRGSGNAGDGGAFEAEWARTVLNQAIEQMKQQCEQSDRPDVWGVFHDRLLSPTLNREEPPSYDDLIARHGIDTPAQAANLLITGKRMFARTLRNTIAQYAGDDEARIQNEMDDLMNALAQLGSA